MTLLVAGLILFLGTHSLAILAPHWRDACAARSPLLWKVGYAALSLLGLVWMVQGYGQARLAPWPLYALPVGVRHLTALLMLPVFPLLLAAYLPGRIKTVTLHPMLLATQFWALAHLLANGNLADVLLFGSLLIWAGADRASLKRRPDRRILTAPATPLNDALALVAGLSLYGLFVWRAHAWLIGVAPF